MTLAIYALVLHAHATSIDITRYLCQNTIIGSLPFMT